MIQPTSIFVELPNNFRCCTASATNPAITHEFRFPKDDAPTVSHRLKRDKIHPRRAPLLRVIKIGGQAHFQVNDVRIASDHEVDEPLLSAGMRIGISYPLV